jgi:hypothetical protein
MIRILDITELEKLLPLARKFFYEMGEKGVLNEDHFIGYLRAGYLNNAIRVFSDEDVTCALGMTFYHEMFTGDYSAGEIFWVSQGRNGIKLLNYADDFMKNWGVKFAYLNHTEHLTPALIEKIYKKKGFLPAYRRYRKEY